MNLPNSQSPTSKILAATFIKEDILNPTLSSAVEYQIKYTTASDTEPQDNGFLNTSNLIYSAYRNVKYKKIQGALLKEIN